jgi:hypothetical protein
MEGFMGGVVASKVLPERAQVTGDYIFAALPLACRDSLDPSPQAPTAMVAGERKPGIGRMEKLPGRDSNLRPIG